MAKRSKRHPTRQNKDQVGCMSGWMNIFDFRHGRATKRLLSDRRHVTKKTVDPSLEVNLLTSSDEQDIIVQNVDKSESPAHNVVKTSVKKLMEEEMIHEQQSTSQTDPDEPEFFDHENGSLVKTHEHIEKAFDSQELAVDDQVSTHKTTPYSDLEALMNEILLVYKKRNGQPGSKPGFSVLEEKLSAAVEVFMNETSSDRSKDFIDTFQMLSSNKELFLKLLQDQNSCPLDTNDDEKSKSTSRSGLLENGPGPVSPSPNRPVTSKPRTFFRRRSKSHEIISLNGNDCPFPSNRIVILKPGSPDNLRNKKNSSNFSFMEIKKRLKNAIKKDQPKPGCSETWSSPNRDHFYTEKFAKRVSKLREPETENDENGQTSQRISNIYIEAKKHLSEMLTGGDEDVELMIERLPRSLGRILSLPEYNAGSSGSSPRGNIEHGFVTAQMRPDDNSQPCSSIVDLEAKPDVCDEVNHGSYEGVPKIEKLENQEETKVVDVSCEQRCSSQSIDDDEHREIVEISNEERSPERSKLDLREENEFSSPTESLLAKKVKESESTASDITGRPSPVSVLESLFSDNEISPASTVSRPVEVVIQPRRLQFEDQETSSIYCTENEESVFEYVEAVLLASDLNWAEFETRWLSSIEILDPSLFDELEIFSNRPYDDQKLLFDSTNEILKESCDCYLDFFHQSSSFIRQTVQPIPDRMNLINEVYERIESRLYSGYPQSLDELVTNDLGISRTWMDLRFDTREIVFEIDELIFDDMMDETVLPLVNDRVGNES